MTRGSTVPLPFRIVACCLLPVLSLPPVAFANPQGAAVRHGQVRIDGGAGRLQIRQMTQRAVIDWESFSIDQGELTRFIQPGASSAVLNRVRGSSASQIEGMLRANGRVYLINPNGILIGPNGSVDVAGFVASTLDPGDRPFLRGGSMRFSGGSDAAVINLGSISALDGDVVLMGASVLNAGEIRAPRGTAALAAGNDILLAESGEERVFVRGAGGASKADGVTNTGNIEANIAELKAHGGNIYGMAVKNEGRVAATGVTRSGGQIFLSAGGGRVRSSGSLKAKRSDGSGGRIKVDSGTTGKTEVGGTVDASGDTGSGGEIAILGNEIEVFDGTLILNDGETTGGTTRIGGGRRGEDPAFANAETLTVGSDVVISANALGIGNGGEVILFSNGSLVFNGSISAHAGDGGGDGGFVELSGKRSVTLPSLTERLDLSAPKGTPGTLLYDPIDIAILAGNPPGDLSGSPVSQNTLYAGDIADFLTSVGSLIVTTDDLYGEDWGDITMEGTANITWSSGNHLTLLADNDFIMDPGAIIYSMGAGSFAVTAARSIVVGNGAAVTTTNGNLELSANQQPGATGGNFTGVSVNGGTIQTLGSGILNVAGRGGDFGAANVGVRVAAGGRIIGGTSGIQFVTGRGGSSDGSGNIGVEVNGTDSRISTNGANLRVTGFGGGTGATSGSNSGVMVTSNGIITSGSGSGINVEGRGGTGGGDHNKGIWVSQSGPNAGSIVSGGGYLDLLGFGGGSGSSTNNQGIQIAGSNTLVSAAGAPLVLTATAGANSAVSALSLSGTVSTGNQAIHLISDGTEILGGATINSGNAATTVRPLTNGFAVNVGGSDVAGTTLGLTDAELDAITAGTVQIGNNSSGPITVGAAITHGNHLSLVSGQGITFNQSVTMTANRNFSAEATGTIGFSSTGSLAASGTGSIGLSTARNLSLSGGSGITVVDGALTLEANSAGTTTGSFQGIDLDNALLQSLGSGGISLSGRGGITGNQQYGVILRNGADILGGTDGLVSITGFGGNSAGIEHYGIYLTGNGTSVTSSGADVALTGTGGNGSASSGIGIIGASVTAGDTGSLTLQGTGGATTGGAFLHGIYLYEAFINSAGGDVTVTGFAGSGSSAAGDYTGVHLDYTTISSGGTGTVTVAGTAGTAALSQTLIGVDVRFESQIRSSGGNVIVTGIGGATTNPGIGNGSGVRLIADGTITAGGTGAVSVTGTGGNGTTIGHEGIVINGSGFDSNLARIGAGNGETTITAISGNTASHALVVGTNHAGRITSGNNNAITIHADSIDAGSAGIISSGAGNTTILTRTAGTRIDLGGNDVLAGAPLTLGLTDAELDRISAGTLLIGDNQTGTITFSNPITHANNLSLLTGQGIAFNAGLTMATDRDLMVGAAGAIVFSSTGSITSSGTGDVAIDGGRGVRLESNSFINTVDGTVFVHGNPDGTGTGLFEGIYLGNGAAINTHSGQISLTGHGGDGTSGGNHGVHLDNTSVIGSQLGPIEITGFGRGAPGSGSTQEGVLIKGNITTAGNGTITIAGTGGNATSGNPGVQLFDNVLVSTVNGNLSITGTSGAGSNSPGIQVADYGSGPTLITSTAGNISLSGNGSAGEAEGILAFGSGVSIGGGTGNVDFTATGALSLTSNASIAAIGPGAVSLTSNRNISLGAGTSVTTVNGNLTVSANQQTIPDNGDFIGILVDGGTIQSTGTGQVSVRGKGGNKILPFTNSDYQIGVAVRNGGQILGGTTGTLLVEGIGRQIASGRSNYNYGVQVRGSGSLISSNGASVSVTGLGGNGFNDNFGIFLQNDGRITSGGAGNVTVSGTGGNGEAYNNGITISSGGVITSGGAGTVTVTATGGTNAWEGSDTDGLSIGSSSSITSGGGDVFVTGYGGIGGETSYGVGLYSSGMITSGGGNVTVTGEARNVTFSNGYQGGVGLWNSDAKITSGGGNVTVIGTGATGGRESYGVILTSSASITSGGAGTVSVTGTAGTASDYSEGVAVYSGADITSNLGAVSVTGYAGTATGAFGYSNGIRVHGSGSTITSGGGNVSVTGSVTAGGANESYGVIVNSSGQIISTGFSNLTVIGNSAEADFLSSGVALWGGGKIVTADGFATVEGTGSTTTNLGSTSSGVLLDGLGSQISTTGGNLLVDGTGGTANGPSYGIWLNFSSSISATGSSVLTVDGTSGSGSDISYGVALYNDADILGGDGAVFVTGTSGTVTNSNGIGSGVALHVGNVINSTGGNVSVTGQGGTGGIENRGVSLFNNSLITAGGTGSVSVTGFGGDTAGIIGFNESSAGVGILSNGTITSTNGAVTVTGTGGDANGVRAFSYGVRLADTGATITSGGGNVSVTGTGGAVGLESYGVSLTRGLITSGGTGTVQVEGYGGGGLQYNEGVSLYAGGTITSNSGAVSVIGQGGTGDPINDSYGSAGIGIYNSGSKITSGGGDLEISGTGGIGPTDNYGIWIWDGGRIEGSTGTLSVTGTGGSDSSPSGLNHGILIEGLGSRITGSGGNMTVTGIGGGDGSASHGIRLQDRAEIVYSGSGLLTVEGAAGVAGSFGISLSNATNGGASIRSTGSGNILLITDSLEITSNTESIQAGTNRVSIRQRSNRHLIDLGGSDTTSSLGLSDAELDRITANLIEIGNGSSGTFTVSNPITSTTHLNLRSGDGFDILDAITMAVDKHLDIATSDPGDGLISLSGSNAILSATGTGNISLTSPRNIRVTSGSGLSTVDGNLTLTANQELSPTSGNFSGIDLDDADLSTTGTGTLTLTGRGGDDEGGQHGILLRGGSSLTTNARNLTLSGAAPDPLSSGLRIELANLGAGGGTIQLTGNGGTTSISSTDSSATIGSATDTILMRSNSGDVEIAGQVRGADLQVQDFSGSESVDFLLTNTANDVDRINAFSNGSNGRIASLDFRDADGFLVTEFLGAGGILASGNVSLRSNFFSGAPVVVDRPVRSAGGNILLRGRDVVIEGTEVTAAGSGSLTLESGRAILVRGDSLLSVTGGEMSLEANRDEVSRQGLFTGITVLGSRLQSLGTGGIRLSGAGGDGGTGSDFAFPGFTNPSSNGIRLDGGTVISSSDTSTNDFGIELYGSGGRGASDCVGVSLAGVDTILSSAGRSILVEGFGGGDSTGQRNRGILFTGGLIQAANTGNVTLYGSGGDGVNENDGIQLNGGASAQVAGGDLTLDGYAGETRGIGVMLGNTAGDLSVTGTGSATVKGSGTNANGVVLGNSSAVIGGVSADYVDLFSREGNVTLQREALAGGNVFINADFGNTLVEGEVRSGTGDIEIEGDNVTIDAPVTATYGDVTVTFGDNFEPGESEPEEPLDITPNFDGTGTINELPTAGGRVRYVGGNGNGDLLTFAGHTASGIDLDSADLSLIENVIGTGSSDDRLRGPAAASSYQFTGPGAFNVGGVAYAAFENVLAGGGDDVFAFTANASIGGRLDAGGGTNTLDYSGYGTGVIVDLPLGVATGIVGGFENIANFSGSGNIDTVTGPGSASIYTFSGIDSMQVGTVSVSGFENLIAGPLEDQFIFLPGSLMRGFLDGGAATVPVNNLLDYSLFGAPVTVDLGNSTAGNLPGGFTGINRFRGSGSIRDLFTGPNVPTQYLFSAANTFGTSAFEASGFENLTGGNDTDLFLFAPGTGLAGNLSGGDGPGNDLLSYALFGRPVTVNIGPNTASGIGGRFSGIERITGSSGNDRFNFLNQTTINFVDGGGGTDLIEINDSNLRGDNTYDISANSVSRNPLYTFSNVEALRLFLGTGNNTINSGFFPFTQFLHGGNGFNTLNLPGVTTLNGPSPIGNVHHFGFDAPRPGGTDTGGLLQLEVDQTNNTTAPNTPRDNFTENRFSIVDPATLNSQIGALGGAFSAAIVAQSVIATVDGNSYLVLRPFSLDGSGLSPSNLGLAALNESLGVDANLELAAAIGFDGPVFLFNPDGPYSLDLSGVPADPAILTLLQESLNIAAAAELSAALGLTLTVSITGADGIVPTGLDGSVPGQNVILLFGDQLGAPAEAELNAAISGGN